MVYYSLIIYSFSFSSPSRSIAAEAVTFGAPKVTKSALSRNTSLPHRASALQIGQNRGCNLFAGLTVLSPTPHAKICYALQPHKGHHCFVRFWAEASLLKKKPTRRKSINNTPKRAGVDRVGDVCMNQH